MASLQRYTSKGYTYWRLVESKRVNGKPKLFVIEHLGTADNLRNRLSNRNGKPFKSKVYSFGSVAALTEIANELKLVEIIDRYVGKRSQGVSVGAYILIAAINRCIAPCSKNLISRWYQKTSLSHWLKVSPKQLTSQRFWDNMDYLTQDNIREIEGDIVQRLINDFQIDPSLLIFDCTNFDTFIDTDTPSDLAKRGHAKSKRNDLRLVGLALLVSREFHIPLFSEVYSGNRHDSKSFASALGILSERIAIFEKKCDSITLVFDKGNNSETNQEILDDTDYYFVGSLVPTQHEELLQIPLKEFTELADPRFEGVKAYRASQEVFGVVRTIVITWSQILFEKQVRGIEQELSKKRRQLRDLAAKLRRSQLPGAKGKGYTESSLAKRISKILTGQHMKKLIKTEIVKKKGCLEFSFWTDRTEYRELKKNVLGKRILFTNQDLWKTEDIVDAYRAQHHVESAFRQMKNPVCVSWSPMWHWTDSKIRVHAFYCLIALMLSGLLQRRLYQHGIKISVNKMFQELGEIQEVKSFTMDKPTGRPRSTTTLSELNPIQNKIYKNLKLAHYFSS